MIPTLWGFIKETSLGLSLHKIADLTEWRNWLVNAMFLCGAIFIPLGALFSIPILLFEKNYDLIFLDALVCLILLTKFFFFRSHNHRFWALCGLIIVYVMTISFFIRLGPHYTRTAWLMMNSVMAALFFGTRAAFITALINSIILLSCYYFISPENLIWAKVHEDPLSTYLGFVVNTTFIALGSSLLVGFLLDRLDIAFKKQQQMNRRLQESEQKYRLITENVADVIWTTDMELHFTFISPSIYQLEGYTVKEGLERSIPQILTPDSLKKVSTIFKNKRKQIESDNDEGWKPIVFEAEQYCKDGRIIWTSNNVRILPGPDQHPISVIGVTRDITERKKTHELIIQSEKMLSLGGLAAGMAHEINNPLAGMIQSAQVVQNRLTKNYPANEKAAEDLGVSMAVIQSYMEKRDILKQIRNMNEAGSRAAKIIHNMLSFARKGDSIKTEHQLNEIIDNTIELVQNDYALDKKYDFKQVEVIRKYSSGIPSVLCEVSKIQQVLFNLFKNASQAMGSGQKIIKDPKLTLRLSRLQNWVCLEIEDNGPGMDTDTCKRIFEPFFTTKSDENGTGLGLSVSYFIIVEDHGGEMEASSILGKGTKFTIKLPVKQ
ncbi:MAG: PAS domain S-box protein [Proteobacteria bacterium]|nr:PAS domain S-box protein [Pseudomonadota bacterium]